MNSRTPSYRLHKPSGQAVVTLGGRDFYLGRHGSKESRDEYDRLVSEWLSRGRRPPGATADITVNELLLAYLYWVDDYYVESEEPQSIRFAVRPLKKLYGCKLAADFGPLALKAVRQAMVSDDLCRKEVNKRVSRIVRVFKWGVENELVPASVHQGLRAVAGLRQGRTKARESSPVKPVPEAFVDAIRSYVRPQVWAMIQLQRMTGMRPGEVTRMRGCDLNTSGRVWEYRPAKHKTQHHGHRRVVFLGPRAQAVLRPWLKTDLEAYLFSPAEAREQQDAERKERRKTRVQPSQRRRRRKAKPRRAPKALYSVAAYGNAIRRGCLRADTAAHKEQSDVPDEVVIVPHWHAHQLRHNAATWLRREFGLEVARVVLGHRSPVVTEVYAERDEAKAVEVMARIG